MNQEDNSECNCENIKWCKNSIQKQFELKLLSSDSYGDIMIRELQMYTYI